MRVRGRLADKRVAVEEEAREVMGKERWALACEINFGNYALDTPIQRR